MYWRIFTMTENKTVLAWLEEMKAMCQPDNVVWIDGSEEQLEALRQRLLQQALHSHVVLYIPHSPSSEQSPFSMDA